MNKKAVCIYQPGETTYRGKVKATFAFFDEIFHLASATIELNHLVGVHFHRCDNKGIQMNHLPIRLFDFENHSARMAP